MTDLTRRALVAAGGTVAMAVPLGKLRAQSILRTQGTGDVDGDPQDVGVLHALPTPKPLQLQFTDADGKPLSLADYRGRGVVLNLWATWCVPCVREMPSLDALARTVAASGIAVLPLSSDRQGAPVVQRFYADRGIKTLPVLLDPSSAVAHALNVRGIPTTLLIDKQGREVAWLEGGADWSAPDAVAAVRLALA